MSERSNLRRTISLAHLVGIEVGQSIGAGIFALTGLALALLAVFYLTNLLGARIAIWVQAVMVVLLLAALGLFSGLGLPQVRLENFSPLFTGGLGGFAVAASILTFTILGANAAVELGDEIVEPSRNIPRSFLISIPLVTLIYVIIAVVAAGVTPWAGRQEDSLAAVAARFMRGPAFVYFVLGGGFLAVVTTLNATYLWGTKSLVVISEDGLFPRALARISPRLGTPHWFLTIIFLISSAALLLAGDRVETFASFASLGGIIIFIPVMGAALGLRRRNPEVYGRTAFPLRGPWYYLAPVMGLLLCLVVIVILLVDLGSHRGGFAFLGVFAVWVGAGALYASLRLRRQRREAHIMSRMSG